MKKILTLLLIIPIFIACSKDDDTKFSGQDYTSFAVTIDSSPQFPNCVAGYKLNDGTYKKIADLGTLTKGKYSPEIRVNDNSITEIYVFTDYNGGIRFNEVYKLNKNSKNSIVVGFQTSGIGFTDKSDPKQYPQ